MNPNNQNNVRIFSCMLPIIVLLVLSCNSSNQNKPADTPKDTTATVPKPVTAAPDPAAPFYGTWDREQNGNFRIETFGKATKTGDKYTGTITNVSNLVTGNYAVDQNSIEITLKDGNIYKFEFNVSNGGNTITLASTPPIVYTKGSNHTIIQDEALSFAVSSWRDPQTFVIFDFLSVHKSDQGGWSGTCFREENGIRTDGEFSITKPGSITIKLTGIPSETYVYTFKNNKTILEFTRNNNSTIFNRL